MQVYASEWSKQPNAPTTPPPLLLVTLIDDVYDTFARLSAPREVFDIQSAISDEYRRREEKREEPTDADSQYVLAQQQVITTMLRILDWRSREISAGDSLAIRGDGRSFVVAIKHPTQVVRDLILSECGMTSTRFRPVYLSHPITRLRKEQKGPPARDWPDFVSQFHNFVRVATDTEVDDGKLLLFMPTAIDEFRITDRGDESFPSLHRRWPLISEDYNALLYEIPSAYGTYEEFEKTVLLEAIFNPVGSARHVDANRREVLTSYAENVAQVGARLSDEKKPQVSALFDILRQQISAQIAFRDHTLVRQCGRFLLYRPLFKEGIISGGVGAELKNWAGIASHSLEMVRKGEPVPWTWGPVVFVHDEQDTPKAIEEAKIITNVAARLPEFADSFDLTVRDNFEEWLRRAVLPGDDLLSGAPSPQEREAFTASARRFYQEERRNAEFNARTGGRGPKELRREIVVEGLDRMEDNRLTDLIKTRVIPALISSESF